MHMTCLLARDDKSSRSGTSTRQIASNEAAHQKKTAGKRFPAVLAHLTWLGSGGVFETRVECVVLSLAVALVGEAAKVWVAGELRRGQSGDAQVVVRILLHADAHVGLPAAAERGAIFEALRRSGASGGGSVARLSARRGERRGRAARTRSVHVERRGRAVGRRQLVADRLPVRDVDAEHIRVIPGLEGGR